MLANEGTPIRAAPDEIECALFRHAWAVAHEIPGWLAEDEAKFLYRCACDVSPESSIVEVGAFRGKSTALFAHANRRVITVDPMRVGSDAPNLFSVSEADVQALKELLASFPNIDWFRTTSDNCPLPQESIGLLYIDGDHQYPAPLLDYRHFRPKLDAGAFVAFHDFQVFGGVTRTIRELEQDGEITGGRAVGSMYIARRAPSELPVPQVINDCFTVRDEDLPLRNDPVRPRIEVTGFHLVFLCHRFGRRGRAFAASIAQQADNPFKIHLTCFYGERQDARLIVEGATAGNNIPSLSLIRIHPERVMQRAMHFSSVKPLPEISHTVFLDCDLWFPPNFWRDYGNVIGCEPAGYWSCRIMDTSPEDAEQLAADWDSLTEQTLSSQCFGVRHDGFYGMVGHFQCVPSEIAVYPEDSVHAVNGADEVFSRQAVEMSLDKRKDRRIGTVNAYHLGHPSYWTGSPEQL